MVLNCCSTWDWRWPLSGRRRESLTPGVPADFPLTSKTRLEGDRESVTGWRRTPGSSTNSCRADLVAVSLSTTTRSFSGARRQARGFSGCSLHGMPGSTAAGFTRGAGGSGRRPRTPTSGCVVPGSEPTGLRPFPGRLRARPGYGSNSGSLFNPPRRIISTISLPQRRTTTAKCSVSRPGRTSTGPACTARRERCHRQRC